MPIKNKGIFSGKVVSQLILANDWPTAQVLYTQDILETAGNLYYTDARVNVAVRPILTTGNVAETTNQYFTNVRVLQAVDPKLTTANVAETTNQYFTNVRVLQAVDPKLTTANVVETNNLYYTNSRVLSALVYANVLVADLTAAGNLVANGLIIRGIVVNDNILTGNVTITNITNANVISANIVSSQVWQGLYTANVIESPTNLYFTNTRARTAFLPGKGIAISGDGVITNTGAPFEYNVGIDGSGYANVLSSMSRLVTFSGTSTRDRFLLRSLHITNISGLDAVISGNVLYATGNTAFFANLLPVPADSAVELMLNTQLFQPNDIVNLQGFTSAGVATSNLLQAVYTYETFSQDDTYQGTGKTLAASNTNILVYDSTSTFSIIESIKVVNLDNRIIPVKVYWADANNVIKAHLAFNTPIPPNSSFETISTPKRISTGDRLFARFNNAPNNSVSIFISARLGYNYAVSGLVSNVSPSGTASVSFSSSEPDGTLLYYTIE